MPMRGRIYAGQAPIARPPILASSTWVSTRLPWVVRFEAETRVFPLGTTPHRGHPFAMSDALGFSDGRRLVMAVVDMHDAPRRVPISEVDSPLGLSRVLHRPEQEDSTGVRGDRRAQVRARR